MSETKICRFCGNEIKADAKKCKFCKKELDLPDTPELFCTRCKAPVNEEDYFCQHCGAIFKIPENTDKPFIHNINGIPYHIGILLTSLALGYALTVAGNSGKEVETVGMLVYYLAAFLVSEIFLYIYFLPTILAIENNRENMLLLYICNLLLGVTVVGWFIALIMALKSEE